MNERATGILLHPTSLPGRFGIGDLGPGADAFLDWMAEGGQSYWQVLPLGPTGAHDSPYGSPSAFAGNPLLISPERLVDEDLLSVEEIDAASAPSDDSGRVDFARVIPWKEALLRASWERFRKRRPGGLENAFEAFVASCEGAGDPLGSRAASRADQRPDAADGALPRRSRAGSPAGPALDGPRPGPLDEASGESGAIGQSSPSREEVGWLDEWALFSALKARFGGGSWTGWDAPLRRRERKTLERARTDLRGEIDYHRYVQFLFFRQWERLRASAARRGIRILGDLPIYVAPDCADVWANQSLFCLDAEGRPEVVAGVPPDYFSETGQLWGNPLYRWDRIEATGYLWWIDRMRATLTLADLVRVDHFRGFAAYWEVPAGAPTSAAGRWVTGPGERFFVALRAALGDLPLVAEDLGHITEDVHELRRRLGLPGMRVFQFGFGDPASEHRPDRHTPDMVAYTGTHDNDTARGWFTKLGEEEKRRVLEFLDSDGAEIEWDMIRSVYGSRARLAIVPLQDVLGLGSESRMNVPSRVDGNWAWRARADQLRHDQAARLRALAQEAARLP